MDAKPSSPSNGNGTLAVCPVGIAYRERGGAPGSVQPAQDQDRDDHADADRDNLGKPATDRRLLLLYRLG